MDLGGGPTFEDLSIDDNLSQLERVVRYSSSSIALQRLVHVKMLAETAAAVGYEETVRSIVPLLEPLSNDEEHVVRQHLGEQLDQIARTCAGSGKEGGYRLIIETILPTLQRLLGDSQSAVRAAAGESLVGVAKLMKATDLGQHVLTIVLQLAHDDEQEELRMTAAELLNNLAESLGQDLCKQFVTPEMVSLSEDPVFRVRKATALNLHNICRVVGDAGVRRLLPAYKRLTKDDMYRVRKACTESLVNMSKAVGPEVSSKELTPVFVTLATDSSKIVRTGALQHLGPLISTLPGDAVTEDLVQYFTSTAIEHSGDPGADADLRLYCAFSFPAVVLTLGAGRWGLLREAFESLVRDHNWCVRKTLSHSLHEVAKVLKTQDVEEDLIPCMEAFLRDVEEVRLGVMKHLAQLFEHMSPPTREQHLGLLAEILQTTSPFNWRLRELLAGQLPDLAPLLSPDVVFSMVVPVAFTLLNDAVSIVRERTFEAVAPLLQMAGMHSENRQASMVSRVRELAHASTYQTRQMYVYICHRMTCTADSPEHQEERTLFVKEFVPSLAELAGDRVVNVRIAMSRTLSKCPDWVLDRPEIRLAVQQLNQDTNADVRHFVSLMPPIMRELPLEDKAPWLETSSVKSDESTRTQWSVSTQRSAISMNDFLQGAKEDRASSEAGGVGTLSNGSSSSGVTTSRSIRSSLPAFGSVAEEDSGLPPSGSGSLDPGLEKLEGEASPKEKEGERPAQSEGLEGAGNDNATEASQPALAAETMASEAMGTGTTDWTTPTALVPLPLPLPLEGGGNFADVAGAQIAGENGSAFRAGVGAGARSTRARGDRVGSVSSAENLPHREAEVLEGTSMTEILLESVGEAKSGLGTMESLAEVEEMTSDSRVPKTLSTESTGGEENTDELAVGDLAQQLGSLTLELPSMAREGEGEGPDEGQALGLGPLPPTPLPSAGSTPSAPSPPVISGAAAGLGALGLGVELGLGYAGAHAIPGGVPTPSTNRPFEPPEALRTHKNDEEEEEEEEEDVRKKPGNIFSMDGVTPPHGVVAGVQNLPKSALGDAGAKSTRDPPGPNEAKRRGDSGGTGVVAVVPEARIGGEPLRDTVSVNSQTLQGGATKMPELTATRSRNWPQTDKMAVVDRPGQGSKDKAKAGPE